MAASPGMKGEEGHALLRAAPLPCASPSPPPPLLPSVPLPLVVLREQGSCLLLRSAGEESCRV